MLLGLHQIGGNVIDYTKIYNYNYPAQHPVKEFQKKVLK